MAVRDGGAAFPRPPVVIDDWVDGSRALFEEQRGMSLRDYFAAQAMQSMLRDTVADEAFETYQRLARDAYTMADAMLAERERGS